MEPGRHKWRNADLLSNETLSFATGWGSFSTAVRRPSRERLAAPSALPGPAPAQPAAARCLHSFTIPDGPAAIRSCSAPPLAASLRRALESLIRSAGWDVASTPTLEHQCLVLNQCRCNGCRVAIHGDQVTEPMRCLTGEHYGINAAPTIGCWVVIDGDPH